VNIKTYRLLETQEVIDEILKYPHAYIFITVWEEENNRDYVKICVSNDMRKLNNTYYIDYMEFDHTEDNWWDYLHEIQKLKNKLKTRFKHSKVTSDLRR